MKVKVNTFGQFFSLFVDVPIRTPAVINITEKQYELLEKLAKVNGWEVELVKEEPKVKKPKVSESKKESEDSKK